MIMGVWSPFTKAGWCSPNFSCLTVAGVPFELAVHPPFSINGEIKALLKCPWFIPPFQNTFQDNKLQAAEADDMKPTLGVSANNYFKMGQIFNE